MATSSSQPSVLLDYAVATSPSPLQVSGIDASITIDVSNSGFFPVNCSGIIFSFNIGDDAASNLSATDPKCFSQNPSWQIIDQGNGSFLASPFKPADGIILNQGLVFIFSDIQVNDTPGTAPISITEMTADQTANGSIPVSKFIGNFSFGDFVANPPIIPMGGSTVLTWTTSGGVPAPATLLLSLSWENLLKPIDVTDFQTYTIESLSQDTVIYLTATIPINSTQSLTSVLTFTVSVFNASFQLIQCNPAPGTSINLGDAVTFNYQTENVDYCALVPNLGTGLLPPNGSVSFIPTTTFTIFTLNGYKRSNFANMKSLGPYEYLFNPGVLNSFSATPPAIYSGYTGSVTLSWNLTSALPVSIDQGVGNVSGNSVIVNVTQATSFVLTYQTGAGNVTSQPLAVSLVSLDYFLAGKTYGGDFVDEQIVYVIEFSSNVMEANLYFMGSFAGVLSLSAWGPDYTFTGLNGSDNPGYTFQFNLADNTLMITEFGNSQGFLLLPQY